MSVEIPWLWPLHAATACALVGLIWTVQLAIYPLFRLLTPEIFPAVHVAYMQRITWVVAPLMLVEVATAAALVWLGKQDFWFLASVVPIGVVWLSTALVQVPLHTKLTLGYDRRTIHLLVQTNWLRTLGWTVRVVILFLTQR